MKIRNIKYENLDIEYANFGKEGKNIVIIPGLLSSVIDIKKQRYLFRKYYKDLAKKYNVYIFGKNKNIHEGYTIENMADDQLKALEILKIKKTYLIGISQGGMISQSIAIKDHNIVEKLIICVSTSKTNDETKNVINNWINMSKLKDLKNLVVDLIEKSLYNKKIKNLNKFYFLFEKLRDKINYDNFIIHAKSCLNHDCQKDLDKINCPVFLIAAKNDKVISHNDSIIMSETIKNNKIKIYNNMGHDIYSNSKEVNKDIINYLEK